MANSFGHQSPASSLPPLTNKTVNTGTWGTTGTTCTIADEYINSNSVVLAYATGGAPAGAWGYTVTQDQVVITSSATESGTLPIAYVIL